MQYVTYSAAELAQDTYFQRWILEQDHSVDLFWTNWLLEHPDKKPVVEEAKRMVELLGFDQNYERNQHFAEVWNEVSAQTIDRKPQLMKYAALWIGVLLVSGIAAFWLWPSGDYTYRTLTQQESFTLPDGSTVALNANSTISYRVDRSGNREVDLVGEGFFDVVKQRTADDRKAKFSVRTKTAVVEVLGTSFGVSQKDQKTQVVLASGVVKVLASKQRSVQLEPGEFVEVSNTPTKLRKKVVDAQLYSSWVSDQVVFEQTPLRQIFNWVEDRYGKQIQLDTAAISVDSLTFTATIPNVELSVVLEAVAIAHQLDISESDEDFFVKRR